jgi:hypothetical protein
VNGDRFYVDLGPDHSESFIEIFNAEGSTMYSKSFDKYTRIAVISDFSLDRGIYIVRISSGDATYYHKILIDN